MSLMCVESGQGQATALPQLMETGVVTRSRPMVNSGDLPARLRRAAKRPPPKTRAQEI
jgi:hypothetical protein